jgi:hypothetical protein
MSRIVIIVNALNPASKPKVEKIIFVACIHDVDRGAMFCCMGRTRSTRETPKFDHRQNQSYRINRDYKPGTRHQVGEMRAHVVFGFDQYDRWRPHNNGNFNYHTPAGTFLQVFSLLHAQLICGSRLRISVDGPRDALWRKRVLFQQYDHISLRFRVTVYESQKWRFCPWIRLYRLKLPHRQSAITFESKTRLNSKFERNFATWRYRSGNNKIDFCKIENGGIRQFENRKSITTYTLSCIFLDLKSFAFSQFAFTQQRCCIYAMSTFVRSSSNFDQI